MAAPWLNGSSHFFLLAAKLLRAQGAKVKQNTPSAHPR